MDLPDDFQHMHALLCLHVWLLLVRLRPEGKAGKALAQQLYDNFQDDVEARVRAAGVKVGGRPGGRAGWLGCEWVRASAAAADKQWRHICKWPGG